MERICQSLLKISEPVKYALAHRLPIVALESTIISHGMPYPQNKVCALSIEKMVRDSGACPATIAIINGKIHIGLQQSEIQLLASTGRQVRKVSRRDLPYVISSKKIGATTVSATMIGAHAAGIDIFVTGGIGGVHRGYEKTMDISADLQQLGATPVSVVSAGVKSILDIPRTLQYLQTKGVPVLAYKSKYFPAFFSASSGLNSPFTVESEREAAKYIWAQKQLGLKNGILIAVPNDKPAQSAEIQKAISQAIMQAEDKNISGPQMTPFLLKRVNQLTQGKSLNSNISLVHNNAKVGSKIAIQLSQIHQQTMKKAFKININQERQITKGPNKTRKKGDKKIVIIGGAAMDYQFKAADPERKFQLRKSCAGKSRKTMGGVARNIAECCSRFQGFQINLISAFGEDDDSKTLISSSQQMGIDVYPIYGESGSTTCKYHAIMDENNNQLIGISQMQINQALNFKQAKINYLDHVELKEGDIVIIDSNFDQQSLRELIEYCSTRRALVIFESKGQKTRRIISSEGYKYLGILKMNLEEKKQIETIVKQKYGINGKDLDKWMASNIGSSLDHSSKYSNIKCIVTNEDKNIQIVYGNGEIRKQKVPQSNNIIKVTGAGDVFSGTFSSMLILGKSQQESIKLAKIASKINVETDIRNSTISQDINLQRLQQLANKLQLSRT